jgi:hypothetical protein
MKQVQLINCDSALLSKFDKVESLNLEEITEPTSSIETVLNPPNKIPSGASLGIPDKALKILFP